MSRSNWDRVVKNGVRSIATRKENRTSKNALMLPGLQLKCVKEATQNGLIKKNHTHLHIIEEVNKTAKIIEKRLKALGWRKNKYTIHNNSLHLIELPENIKIDYAFIDVCGVIDGDIARWLHENQEKFHAHARIGLTFCAHVRHGRLFTDDINNVLSAGQQNESMKILAQSNSNWLFKTFGLINGKRNKIRKNKLAGWNSMKEIMQATWSTIYCAFNNFNLSVNHSIQYKEPGCAITMHYIEVQLSGFNKTRQNRFEWIRYHAPEIVRPCSDRSESSRQAWVTRRANDIDLKNKYRQAGLKAARTRKRNQLVKG